MATKTEAISVKGMNCGHCAAKVEKALQSVSGVQSAAVDLEAATATVEYDDSTVTNTAMADAVADVGYEVVSA